jgi:ubiquinone/menaquinone biosynthesis C-methylase UbiE
MSIDRHDAIKNDKLSSDVDAETPDRLYGGDTPFAFHWDRLLTQLEKSKSEKGKLKAEQVKEYFRNKLSGQTLVDLGGDTGGFIYQFIKRIGLANEVVYISVDKFINEQLVNSGGGGNNFFVKDDMLHFLSTLKDDSVNITINGIDLLIIKNDEYHKALADEITRVTKKGGIIFGANSFSVKILKDGCRKEIVAQDETENRKLLNLSRKNINAVSPTGYMTFEENDPQSPISVHKFDDYEFVIEKKSLPENQ